MTDRHIVSEQPDIFAFLRRIRTEMARDARPAVAEHAGRQFIVTPDDTPDTLYDRWFDARGPITGQAPQSGNR